MSCNKTILDTIVKWSWSQSHSLTLQFDLPFSFSSPLILQATAVVYSLLVISLTWLAHQPALTSLTSCTPQPHSLLFTPNYTNACADAHHWGVFQAAKWGYGLIFLDVGSVFLTNSQILAREECQQGCAGWDKLRQVTTGGRREECRGEF